MGAEAAPPFGRLDDAVTALGVDPSPLRGLGARAGEPDFTRLAVPLREDAGLTNGAFQDLMLKAFGPGRRQSPVLVGSDRDASSPFLVDPGRRSTAVSPPLAATAPEPHEAAGSSTLDVPSPRGDRARDVADVLVAIARLLR